VKKFCPVTCDACPSLLYVNELHKEDEAKAKGFRMPTLMLGVAMVTASAMIVGMAGRGVWRIAQERNTGVRHLAVSTEEEQDIELDQDAGLE